MEKVNSGFYFAAYDWHVQIKMDEKNGKYFIVAECDYFTQN